jgi:hypothetical protein
MAYDPENYLLSTTRELQKYVERGFDNSVLDVDLLPIGRFVYQVIMEFPGDVIADITTAPLPKTLVHFELDDSENRVVGFGDNIFSENYDAASQSITPQEASYHQLNFDVGVWASDVSGGTTARLNAQQILNGLFVGFLAQRSIMASSDGGDGGLELLSYHGGQFITERVNEINTYRMVGAELELRVFSRTLRASVDSIPAIEGIEIEELDTFGMEG